MMSPDITAMLVKRYAQDGESLFLQRQLISNKSVEDAYTQRSQSSNVQEAAGSSSSSTVPSAYSPWYWFGYLFSKPQPREAVPEPQMKAPFDPLIGVWRQYIQEWGLNTPLLVEGVKGRSRLLDEGRSCKLLISFPDPSANAPLFSVVITCAEKVQSVIYMILRQGTPVPVDVDPASALFILDPGNITALDPFGLKLSNLKGGAFKTLFPKMLGDGFLSCQIFNSNRMVIGLPPSVKAEDLKNILDETTDPNKL
jgi:hypothetical protein